MIQNPRMISQPIRIIQQPREAPAPNVAGKSRATRSYQHVKVERNS